MELVVGKTKLICYETGIIHRYWERYSRWKLAKQTLNADGYLIITIEKRVYLSSRLIYKAFHSEWDLYGLLQIDHINRIKTDNRIENLRSLTDQQNKYNKDPKGYYMNGKSFVAQIITPTSKLSKSFTTAEEAKLWYLEQKKVHHIIN